MGKSASVKDLGSLALDYCYLKEEQLLRAKGDRRRFRFLAVPKKLIGCGLSADAVLLYSFMLERLQYSVDHGWQDDHGRVYIVYTAKEIQKNLDCQSQKSAELIRRLEDAGLIETMRREKGKANYYFVKVIQDEKEQKKSDIQTGCFENQTGGSLKITPEEVRKSNPIDNTFTDTDIYKSNIRDLDNPYLDETESDLMSAQMVPTTFDDGSKGFRLVYEDEVKPLVKQGYDESEQLMHEVLSGFANRTGFFGKETLRVNQMEISREEVQKRLSQLTPPMIRYAADCIRQQGSELMNPKSYALTALYNAPETYPLYQSLLLKHEQDGEWYKELRARTLNFSERKRELASLGVA